MQAISLKGLFLLAAAATSAAAAPVTTARADYVIVGGGPAGFVLAEQLSRNPRTRVVLLEAGPDGINSPEINTPAYYPAITGYTWDYYSQPDPNLGGHAPQIAQGRVFGGGTAVNGMAYCRGSASVFDEWAERSGNPGLAWSSLLEDFRETSHYTFQPADYEQEVDTTVFGDGPIEVSRVSGLTGFDGPFIQALQDSLGLDVVDMTDGTGIGIEQGLQSIRVSNRTRSYARNAFGLQMENRPNVKMIHDAWVSKIGFAGHTATSVTYHHTGSNRTYVVKSREIIVSGGAINTPKILLLSGVGPQEQLSQLGIPVVADIPAVGANLRDHLFGIVEVEVTADIMTVWQWTQNQTAKALAEEAYQANASGPLGWDNGLAFAALRVPDSVFDGVNGTHYTSLPADRPHVLLEYSTVPFDAATPNISTVTAWASLVQPESAGYVAINSTDYRANPVVFSNYYGSPADKAAMLWSYKKLREILSSGALQSVIVGEYYPGADVTSDEDVWAAIQRQSFSFHHPMGTVAIGQALDRHWRLKGLRGIRVVDSSAFPVPPTCHPQADVYALAHRAAKDIRQEDGV